jgi:AraC-like DNA-binding protein
MPGSGSSLFTDADGYQAGLQGMLDLLVLLPRQFQARLTSVELPSLRLFRAQEASPRVAFVTLPSDEVFVTFPTKKGSLLISSGIELELGDLMFHSRGERLHQRIIAACQWGSISLSPAFLMAYGMAVGGRQLTAPPICRLLHPASTDRQRLLRLHGQAARLAEKSLDSIGHKEVVRALEQDLIAALVCCLITRNIREPPADTRREAAIMMQLEELLAKHAHRMLRTREFCEAIGITQHALQVSCLRQLGMNPGRYQRLRRLKAVRAELMRRSGTVDSVEIVKSYGFADLHGFVAEYWSTYGEMPPIPPRGATN